ncbi:MAG: DUF2341 domain-containing protein [Candidatus Aenigmarchaeota archaeon]|nr:DUF2341 domain-containing protein [Candidatus Aenigmarchaeota archaeon]
MKTKNIILILTLCILLLSINAHAGRMAPLQFFGWDEISLTAGVWDDLWDYFNVTKTMIYVYKSLNVSGDAYLGGELKGIKPSGSYCLNNQILKYNNTNDKWICADGSGSSNWATSGNDIYNSNTDNVGIGTNSPTAKLHVKTSDINTVPFELSAPLDGNYRNPITITNTGSDLKDYSVYLTKDTAILISAGKMRADCGDIRFRDEEGNALAYFLEGGCDSANTKLWVKVPSIPAGIKTIYMHYGNPALLDNSKQWDNIINLGIYGGVFDYEISEAQEKEGEIISMAGGYGHTCILKSNGNVDCYGKNHDAVGNPTGQANDYNGGDAIGVFAGEVYTCVIKSNGNVDCYGENSPLGEANDYNGGDAIGGAAGFNHKCILKSNGNVDCNGGNTWGQSNDYNNGDAIGIAADGNHNCILKSNGNVICWGSNDGGKANNYTKGDAIGVAAGYYHTCILKSNGNVECYGDNMFGRANNYTNGDAIGVAAGSTHTCILRSNGDVFCYGHNGNGQSNNYNRGDAIGVATGYWHSCILKSNGDALCQGANSYGQSADYFGGDALNPFRKYASPEPTIVWGAEESTSSNTNTLFYIQPQSGNLGIGTTNPSKKVHIKGNAIIDGDLEVKGNVYYSDLVFANNFVITEAVEENALYFLNQKGERIMKLDENGNLFAKGVIKENFNFGE